MNRDFLPFMLRDSILAYLSTATAHMWPLAAAWHLVFAAFIVALIVGWTPTVRLAALTLTALAATVAIVAADAGNPFNALTFAVLAALFLDAAFRGATVPVRVTGPFRVDAMLLLAFAWVYPHFNTQHWTRLLYAAPLGTIPCPTLAAITAVSLLITGAQSTRLRRSAGIFAVMYGVFGMVYLRVAIDAVLAIGGVIALFAAAESRRDLANATHTIST